MNSAKRDVLDRPAVDALQVRALQVRALRVGGAYGSLDASLHTPPAPQDALIVLFPPGQFARADLDAVDEFARELATATVCQVLTSGYTVASLKPFPAAVEDAHAVLAWAARNRGMLGWNGERLIAGGIEAGGNLAAVSAMMARDRGGPRLAGQLLIMPMLDPGLTSRSMSKLVLEAGPAFAASECAAAYRAYLPNAVDRSHPYASPLRSSRMTGLPPAMILSSEDDPLRDEAEQYGAKLIAAGITTTVRRLPPLPLDRPGARCRLCEHGDVMKDIAAFIRALQTLPGT